MALPTEHNYDISAIISAILGSSILTAIATKALDFYAAKLSYKRDKLHDNKIAEIKNFYKSYYQFKLEIEVYHTYTMFSNKKSIEKTKEISEGIMPLLKEFQYQSMIIKLFLDKVDYQKIIEIEKILLKIKTDIDLYHLSQSYPNSYTDFGNRMREILDVDFKTTIPELMNGIELRLRNTFI